MKIFIVRNFKKKLLVFISIMFMWIVLSIVCLNLINNSLYLDVSINNDFEFRHSMSLDINNIYAQDNTMNNLVVSTKSATPLVQSLSEYLEEEGNIRFDYPGILILDKKKFPGSDINLHIDFQKKNNPAFHGFIQEWNMQQPLQDFLTKSKLQSTQNFKTFKSEPVTINGIDGFRWDYVVELQNGESIRAAEVFLKKDSKMYRISYFVPEKNWNSSEQSIFNDIVNSFKVLN
jgi:hypothetical protein